LPTVSKGTYFELIPLELIREILLYLKFQDLVLLQVSEDLFWRLKIDRDYPRCDLDLIVQFLLYKTKNLKPITTIRRNEKDHDVIIVNDDSEYFNKIPKNSVHFPRGQKLETVDLDIMTRISYFIGIQLLSINLYKSIYFCLMKRLTVFSDVGYFIHRINIFMNISKNALIGMIRQQLQMSINDKISLGLKHERFAEITTRY